MSEPKRILVYGLGSRVGGQEEYIMNLYRHMDHSRIVFDIIPHGSPNFYARDEVETYGGRILPIFTEDGHFSSKTLARVLKDARRDHDTIYFNMCALYRLDPFLFAKRNGYPTLLVHSHNTKDPSRGKLANLLHYCNRLIVRHWAKRCFACSVPAGEWLYGKRYFDSHLGGRCEVVPNAIDLAKHSYDESARLRTRQELGIGAETPVYVNVGRLIFQKNQRFALRLFAEIIRSQPDAVFLLVGQGPDRQELERFASELGIADHVMFLGVRKDVADIMSASDLMLFPSVFEGLPLTLLEAQACGLPTIGTRKVMTPATVIDDLMIAMDDDEKDLVRWADAVSSYRANHHVEDRSSHSEEMASAGYDIDQLARHMQCMLLGETE